MTETLLAWVGYIASGVIVLSMMMSSIIKFRWINLIGALLFSVYGFLIGALPVGVLNGIIVLVDAYYLWQIYRKTEVFEILEIKAKSDYLKRFLAFHNERIQGYSPGFDYNPDKNVYWGDLHVHTAYSMDAYMFDARLTPRHAYRFAQGAEVKLVVGPTELAFYTAGPRAAPPPGGGGRRP